MEDDLSQWKQKYLDAVTEIQRLTSVIENLQQQLQESLKGNAEQRKTLTDLETKIDKLIAQTKRRNKRDYGKKTENHNPRPAAVTPKQKTEKAPDAPDDERATGIKHILKNAKNVAHDPSNAGQKA